MARRRVSDVLEAVNLDGVLTVLLARSELADRPLELHHRLRQEVRQLARRQGYSRNPVQVHRVGDLFYIVEYVVEAGRQSGDVLVVEGGDEGLVEAAHDLVRDPVTQPLEVLDLPPAVRQIPRLVEGLLKKGARTDENGSLLLEEVIEALLPGYERQCLHVLAHPLAKPWAGRLRGGWRS